MSKQWKKNDDQKNQRKYSLVKEQLENLKGDVRTIKENKLEISKMMITISEIKIH